MNTMIDGKSGYDSLAQLFNMLNNKVHYVVLRNYECLPNDFDPSIHGDIDILVEDLDIAVSLTHAKKVYPETPTNVAYTIQVGNEPIKFDIRYVGDGYYDAKWESDMLDSAREINQGTDSIRVMNSTNLYFSLIYHAYLQKKKIAPDYPQKLRRSAEEAGVEYKDDRVYLMHQLWNFMKANTYHLSIPKDAGVAINRENLRYVDDFAIVRIKLLFTGGITRLFLKVLRKLTSVMK